MLSDYIYKDPQITFFRKVYRKTTPIQSLKKTYTINSDSNAFIFSYDSINNSSFHIINKIWLFNENNQQSQFINQVRFFLVPYTNKTDFDNKKYQTLEQIFAIKNIKLVSSLSLDSLNFFNFFDYENSNSNYIRLQLDELAFNSLLLFGGKYFLLMHIEREENFSNIPVKFVVKYLMGSQDDSLKFVSDSNGFDYLIKRQIEKKVLIGNKTNLLDIDFINFPLATIVIKSPSNLANLHVKLSDGTVIPFITTDSNPEHSYVSSKFKIFMLEQTNEKVGFVNSISQPEGIYEFKSTDKIQFDNLDNDFQIEICYIFYDLIRYNFVDSLMILKSYDYYLTKASWYIKKNRFDQLVQQSIRLSYNNFSDELAQYHEANPVVFEHWKMDLTKDYNNDDITYSEYCTQHQQAHPEFIPVLNLNPVQQNPVQQNPIVVNFEPQIPVGILNANAKEEIIRFTMLYKDIIGQLVESFEKANAIKNPVKPDDICEVMLSSFNPNEYYYCCANCSGKFSVDFYKIWIEDIKTNSKCPKCLTKINKIPQMYVNASNE